MATVLTETSRIQEFEEALGSFPWFDIHTHIDAAHLTARGLDDILLYHMSISDLYAAGCPSGGRIDEDRTTSEAHRRIEEALPYIDKVRNTSINWGIRMILADLYDWHEPVTRDNWRKLDALIAERAGDSGWARQIMKRANIARIGTEMWRGRDGSADDMLQYALEWAFFARTQWGQPDIPVFELERTWNDNEPTPPISVTFDRKSAPPLRNIIRTADDVKAAMKHYCSLIPYDRIAATAQHIATDMNYSMPDDETMNRALKNREHASEADRDIYASYITHLFLKELESQPKQIVFQFSLGAEALPFESSSRLNQATMGQLADMISRYPKLKFMCFLSSRHADQSMCTLVRELPNLSLAAYWWHNFFPGAIRQVMEERLDMLPVNKQVGFFSDAYCFDWMYGKVLIVRKMMAQVYTQKIEQGQYTKDEALSIAKSVLYDTPMELLNFEPGPHVKA